MSSILWCDRHGGPFSSNVNGWSSAQIQVRNGDNVDSVKNLHFCVDCTWELLKTPDMKFLDKGNKDD